MKKILTLSLMTIIAFTISNYNVNATTGFVSYINYKIPGCFSTGVDGGSVVRNSSSEGHVFKINSQSGSAIHFRLTGPGIIGSGTSAWKKIPSGKVTTVNPSGNGYGFGTGTISSKVKSASVLSKKISGYWYATETVYNIIG